MERRFSRQQNTKQLITESTIVAFISTTAHFEIKRTMTCMQIDFHFKEKKDARNLKLTAEQSF